MTKTSIDLERAEILFDVLSKAAANGSVFGAIAGEAAYELGQLNIEAQKAADERAKEAAAKKAEEDAKKDELAAKEQKERDEKDKKVKESANQAPAPAASHPAPPPAEELKPDPKVSPTKTPGRY